MAWSVVNTQAGARGASGYQQVRPSARAGFRQVPRPRPRPSRWHVVNAIRQPPRPVVIPNYHVDPATIPGVSGGSAGMDALLQQIIAAANPNAAHAAQSAALPRTSGVVTPIPTMGPPPGTDMSPLDDLLRNIIAAATARRTAGYAV